MTDAKWKCLDAYVRETADELGLRDWKIVVERESPPEMDNGDRALACCEVTDGRRHAYLRFSPAFFDETPEGQVATVVHELLHCHFRAHVNLIWRLDETGLLAKAQWALLWESFKWGYENCLDAIACAVADRFDLISWPKETKPSKK